MTAVATFAGSGFRPSLPISRALWRMAARRFSGAAAWVAVIATCSVSVLICATRGFPEQSFAYAQGPAGLGAIVAVALVYASCGALLTRHADVDPVGWLLLAFGLVVATVPPVTLLVDAAVAAMRPAPSLTLVAAWLVSALVTPTALSLLTIVLLRFPSRSSAVQSPRRWLLLTMGLAALVGVTGLLDARGIAWYPALSNPLGPDPELGPAVDRLHAIGSIALLLVLVGAVGSLAIRYRHASPTVRRQLRVILAATIVMVAADTPLVAAFEGMIDAGRFSTLLLVSGASATCLVPMAVAYATVRHHLFGDGAVIGRSVAYLPLLAISGGVFTATLTLVQRLFVATTGSTSDIALVAATLVAAAVITPLRRTIEGIVERRVRDDDRENGPSGAPAGSHPGATQLGTTSIDALVERLAALEACVEDAQHPSRVGEPGIGPQPRSAHSPSSNGPAHRRRPRLRVRSDVAA